MKDDDVLSAGLKKKSWSTIPPFLSIGSMQIRLEYHFEPGSDKDGVTFRLPFDFAGNCYQPISLNGWSPASSRKN